MQSRHIRTIEISSDGLFRLVSDIGISSDPSMLTSGIRSSVEGEGAISDVVFKALIKTALKRVETTPLNRKVTTLLGLAPEVDSILTKQIGVRTDEDLHGLLVSIKPDTDDVILVNQSNWRMDIYLTDSNHHLRAAATLRRDNDQPHLVSYERALTGYAHELGIWAIVGQMARY